MPSVHEIFEAALRSALERGLAGAPPNLAEAMRYSLLAPGKRIRPRLALACAGMIDLSLDAALSAAAALEMGHCFTLIHDDLPCMDDDDFRRGRPSCHKRFGEAMALLAGDALLTLAFESLHDAFRHVEPGAWLRASRRLTWALGPRAVIGGQAAEALLTERSTLSDLRAVHAAKTGALFSASLLVPAELAGLEFGPEAAPGARAIERFAAELGMAFQAVDDLEDGPEDRAKPTNLMSHLPEREARETALSGLRDATGALAAAWPGKSGALEGIAAEVLARLQASA